MGINHMVTHEELYSNLKYFPKTGIFIRTKTTSSRAIKGDVAGTINTTGYRMIMLKGKIYSAHRLAWFYVHGYFPENEIDHINRNKIDNRIKNLREVSRSCNVKNVGNRKDNTSGVKGVSFSKKEKKWRSIISINNKPKNLGYFSDFDEAVCMRLAAEQCLNWDECDSNSPAYQYVKKYN